MTSHRTNRRDAHLPTRPDRTRTAAGGAAQASPAPGIGLSGMGAPTLSLFAGCVAGGCADGRGAEASFLDPTGVAVGRNGDLYLTDCGNHTIRKITAAGEVSTLAGFPGEAGSVDGTGTAARFNGPSAITCDPDGHLYVADSNNNTIRRVSPGGEVTLFAGRPGVPGKDDGLRTEATFSSPFGLALDPAGTLYVTDSNNNTIRRISASGQVDTFAGSGTPGAAEGLGTAASFNNPNFLAIDRHGDLYVADSNNQTIRKITSAGMVSTLAGTAGCESTADGTGSAARFYFPFGLAIDAQDNLYVSEQAGNTIRKVTSAGVVTTMPGVGETCGCANGLGSAVPFSGPAGIALDSAGQLVIADSGNDILRRMSAKGEVTPLAGAASALSRDGRGAQARFNGPGFPAVDAAGQVYVPDSGSHTIRKVSPDGEVTTFAGATGEAGIADGPLATARFNGPSAVALDGAGQLLVVDFNSNTLRKIDLASGLVSTLAGTPGVQGHANGTGPSASFNDIRGLAVAPSGQVFVSERSNTIRAITSLGEVTTLAGTAGNTGSANGQGPAASFDGPTGMALDADGNLYVTDFFNDTVRKVTSQGMVSTLAGSPLAEGSADGAGSAAGFNGPCGVVVMPGGNLLVSDSFSGTIRMITPEGEVTTILGVAGVNEQVPGIFPSAWFSPAGLALDPVRGELYLSTNNAILKVRLQPQAY